MDRLIDYTEAIERTYDLCDIYYNLFWCPCTTLPQNDREICPLATLDGGCKIEHALFSLNPRYVK